MPLPNLQNDEQLRQLQSRPVVPTIPGVPPGKSSASQPSPNSAASFGVNRNTAKSFAEQTKPAAVVQPKPSIPYRIGRDINTAVGKFADVQRAADQGVGQVLGGITQGMRDFASGVTGNTYQAAAPTTPVASSTGTTPPMPLRTAMNADMMGPDRTAAGYAPGISRLGNRITTPQGYAESSDAAGMGRVDAGLRGIQPKDGQSYVSNNFMTVPAYKTPQSLIDAREARAALEASRPMATQAEASSAMPTPPKLAKFDSRTMSFSDLGNVKRANRMAMTQYAQEMNAYNNAVDNAGATQRQAMQTAGALQGKQAELAAEAPYRQAMADYYKAHTGEAQANAGWRQALASGQLTTGGNRAAKSGDNKLQSLELGTDAQGNAMRALSDPSTGALYRFDMESSQLVPMQVPGGAAAAPLTDAPQSLMEKMRKQGIVEGSPEWVEALTLNKQRLAAARQ